MAGPLSHLTVIELAGLGPAPFACMLLADMGARVIRIDRPPTAGGGDLAALLRNDGVVDRGRESLALNLKDPRAVEIVLSLVGKADILVEGYRPGVAERLGLGPEPCLQRNPRLVYGRVTGWGQDGPLAQAAGHDINYIALSGALHAMGSAGQPMVPLNLVGDYGGGGMLLAVGLLAAQAHVAAGGLGQVVDAAMVDGASLLMALQYGLMRKGYWQDERARNFLDGSAHFYGTYECADGKHVAIGAIEPQFYQRLMQLCGIEDPDFEQQWDVGAWPVLRERLAAILKQRTRQQWCELLEGSDACFAPVLSMREAAQHPHNVARATFVERDGSPEPAPAPRFSQTPAELPPGAPLVGTHTEALLLELGYAREAAEALIREGVAYLETL